MSGAAGFSHPAGGGGGGLGRVTHTRALISEESPVVDLKVSHKESDWVDLVWNRTIPHGIKR